MKADFILWTGFDTLYNFKDLTRIHGCNPSTDSKFYVRIVYGGFHFLQIKSSNISCRQKGVALLSRFPIMPNICHIIPNTITIWKWFTEGSVTCNIIGREQKLTQDGRMPLKMLVIVTNKKWLTGASNVVKMK